MFSSVVAVFEQYGLELAFFCVGLVWMIIAMHRRGLESAFLGTRSAEAMWRGNRRVEWFKSAGRDSTFISYTCMLVYTCIFLYYM